MDSAPTPYWLCCCCAAFTACFGCIKPCLLTCARAGKQDRLFTWDKPLQRPRYLPKAIWKTISKQLSVRVLLKVPGFRVRSVTLVTTLLDPKEYPAEELARLYAERWRIELWFRDIKTSMGMEVLRCKSPRWSTRNWKCSSLLTT